MPTNTTGALNEVGKVLEQAFGQQSAVIVADDNTYAVAGKAVSDRLRSNGWTVEESLVFPGTPPLYAIFENVLAVEEKLRATNAVPIVVGSGTLNDITKLAAHRLGRQYMCVSTAASVDGYTAFGAAETITALRKAGRQTIFPSNNPTKTRSGLAPV